jgi:hypothetical protein
VGLIRPTRHLLPEPWISTSDRAVDRSHATGSASNARDSGENGKVPVRVGDFDLTTDELRVVARFAAQSAEEVLPIFEHADRQDHRPRAAVEAAWIFANGAARTKLQRITALEAHRAAKDIADEAAQYAARAAGDAAAAAYLHPLAKATQVGHILRAAANAARAAELNAGDDPNVGTALIQKAHDRAGAILINVLCRYPLAPVGRGRVTHLMKMLDISLRSSR